MRKAIIYFLVLIFLLINSVPVLAYESKTVCKESEILKEKVEKSLYNGIVNNKAGNDSKEHTQMKEDYNNVMNQMYNTKTQKYNNDFSGAYVDSNNDLVVKIKKGLIQNEKEIQELTTGKVLFEKAKYSLNELQKIENIILEKTDPDYYNDKPIDKKIKAVLDSVNSIGVSEEENKVCVTMTNVSSETISIFKEYIYDSDAIHFTQQNNIVSSSSKMYLGNQITVKKNNKTSYYSIGCRAEAKKDGKHIKGFLTAAHNNELNSDVYYGASDTATKKIGKIVARKFGGKIDCSFVQVTNSSYSLTHKIKNKNGVSIKTYVATSLPVGCDVVKHGYKYGKKTGVVKKRNVSVKYNGKTIKGLVQSNYLSGKGDSGGIVYDPEDNSFAGITVAFTYNDGESPEYGKISYYVDEDNLFTNWGGLTDLFLY